MNGFRRDLERLLRRHEPAHARRPFHRIANQDGHVAEQVLAVVERDDGLDLRERRKQALTSLGGGTELDAQTLRQSVIDLGPVGQRRKLDPVDAIARIADAARERGSRQRCLAHAAGADDADQRKRSDHVRERGEIRVPAEQQRRAGREVGCPRSVAWLARIGSQRLGCDSPCRAARFNRQSEPIPAPGDRDDRLRAENLPQRGHLNR